MIAKETVLRKRMRVVVLACMLVLGNSANLFRGFAQEPSAGFKNKPGGIIAVVGLSDEKLFFECARKEAFIVQGLDGRPAQVEALRKKLVGQGMHGRVTVSKARLHPLPYASEILDLIVVDDYMEASGKGLKPEEILRVLVPGGVALLKGIEEAEAKAMFPKTDIQAAEQHGESMVLVCRPVPEGLDDWTHLRYDPSRRATSHDTHVAPSRSLRWILGPSRARTHNGRPYAVVSENGILFYMQDKAEPFLNVPAKVDLVACNAYNGAEFWRRSVNPPSRPYRCKLSPGTLVAGHERVYAVLDEDRILHALDPLSGKSVATYGTATDAMALDEGLAVLDKGVVRLLDVASGRERWSVNAGDRRGNNEFAAGDGRIFVRSERQGHIMAIAMSDGTELWKYKGAPRLCGVQDGILIVGAGSKMIGIHAENGKEKWSRAYGQDGRGSPANIFFPGGLAWANDAKKNLWIGLDPETGEEKRSFRSGFTDKCAPGRATHQWLITGRNDYFNVQTGKRDSLYIARGTCVYPGVIPANGLVYTFPTDCECYPMLYANVAMSPNAIDRDADPADALERGPAFDSVKKTPTSDKDWPTYRHDEWRSAATKTAVSASLKQAWRVQVSSGAVTPPTAADGRVFVADRETHQISAYNAYSGKLLWRYAATGRIPVAPTLYEGLCLFGSEDGFVYALRAEDGALVWRYRVAPGYGSIHAYGRLASAWPILGGILVSEGRAFAVAGRHGPLDGGGRAVSLDPHSGELIWDTVPENARRIDMLVRGGNRLFMWNNHFDPKDGTFRTGKGRRLPNAPVLFASASFLTDAWSNRTLWRLQKEKASLLAFNDQGVFGVDAFHNNHKRTRRRPGKEDFKLFCRPTENQTAKQDSQRVWMKPFPVQTKALALAGETLFAGGPPDSWPTSGGVVLAVDSRDGRLLSRTDIDAAPVQDGLIAALGRLFLSLEDGSLVCLAP